VLTHTLLAANLCLYYPRVHVLVHLISYTTIETASLIRRQYRASVYETTPRQAVLKCSQPSPITQLHVIFVQSQYVLRIFNSKKLFSCPKISDIVIRQHPITVRIAIRFIPKEFLRFSSMKKIGNFVCKYAWYHYIGDAVLKYRVKVAKTVNVLEVHQGHLNMLYKANPCKCRVRLCPTSRLTVGQCWKSSFT